jgi:hypothetical protein
LEGVVVADATFARYRGSESEFASIVEALGKGTRGVTKALRVLAFADGRADSPGESISRVEIARLGFAPPELQAEVRDPSGFVGRLDFYWPIQRIGGEFDGLVK